MKKTQMGTTIGANRPPSLELGVFGLRGDEDGNVRIGILPEREEILIGRSSAADVACFRARSCETEMRQRARPAIPYNPAMIEELLEFRSGRGSLFRLQVRFAAQVNLIHARIVETSYSLSKLVRRGRLKQFDRLRSIPAAELDLRINRWNPFRFENRIHPMAVVPILDSRV